MRWPQILLCFVVGVVSSQSSDLAKLYKEVCNPYKVSEGRKMPQSGYFTPPGIDCPTYAIACHNGEAHLEYCPSGQVFFDNKCRAASTRCGGRDEIDCSQIPGRKMIPNGCSASYFWCTNGILTRHQCPQKTYFNPENGQCDFWENVQLCNPRDPTEAPEVTVPPTLSYFQTYQNSFNCKGVANGDYPDRNQACVAHYFTCSNEIPYLRNCSGVLYFDPDLMACERIDRIPACGGERPTLPPSRDFVCPSVDGDYLDDNSPPCCSSYINCKNGMPTKMTCKEGEAFNPETGFCDEKKKVVGCDPGHCEKMKDGRYKVPGAPACDYGYLECVHGRSFIRQCAETLIFNPLSTFCEFRHDVEECGEPKDLPNIEVYSSRDVEQQYPSRSADTYSPPSEVSEPKFEAKKEPAIFIKETPREPTIEIKEKAPQQYLLSVIQPTTTVKPRDIEIPSLYARYPSISDITERPTPAPVPCVNVTQPPQDTYRPAPTASEFTGPCAGMSDGRYPIPGAKKCQSSYMKCKGQQHFMRQCSATLIFSRATTDCDFPQNVEECRGSISPVVEAPVEQQLKRQQPLMPVGNISSYQPRQPIPAPSDIKIGKPLPPRPVQQPKLFNIQQPIKQQNTRPVVFNQRKEQQPLIPVQRKEQQPLMPVQPVIPQQQFMPQQQQYQKVAPIRQQQPTSSSFAQLAKFFPALQQQQQFQQQQGYFSDPFGKSSLLIAEKPFFACQNNEVFVKCSKTCETTCPPVSSLDCDDYFECVPSCRCKPGYVRSSIDNKCILAAQCSVPVVLDPFYDRGAFEPDYFDYALPYEVEDGWRHDGEDYDYYDSGKPHDHANDFFCKYRDDGRYAMPGNLCTDLYYKCRHHRVQFWHCGSHRYFDPAKKRCTRDSKSKCWDDVVQLPSFFCQGKYESKNFSYPFPDCDSRYYTCSGGDATIHECPSGYRFSDYRNKCVSKHRCHERRGRDADPDKWFCKDKIDHGFSYPKLICTKRYYQCYDGLASFRLCRHDHVWDGFSCVPEQYCIDNDARNIVETSSGNSSSISSNDIKTTVKNHQHCVNNVEANEQHDFVILDNYQCSQVFGVCSHNDTKVHYCGDKAVVRVVKEGTLATVKCQTLQSCLNTTNLDDNLVNNDWPKNDDYCSKDNLGFHYKHKCGQKYALCYCANENLTVCNPELLRLSCKSRHYVFDPSKSECVLRRKVHKCAHKFDTHEFCHHRKRRMYELAPCYNEYVDCRSNSYRQCNRGEFFSFKYGCTKRGCGRRQFPVAADLTIYPDDGADQIDDEFSNVDAYSQGSQYQGYGDFSPYGQFGYSSGGSDSYGRSAYSGASLSGYGNTGGYSGDSGSFGTYGGQGGSSNDNLQRFISMLQGQTSGQGKASANDNLQRFIAMLQGQSNRQEKTGNENMRPLINTAADNTMKKRTVAGGFIQPSIMDDLDDGERYSEDGPIDPSSYGGNRGFRTAGDFGQGFNNQNGVSEDGDRFGGGHQSGFGEGQFQYGGPQGDAQNVYGNRPLPLFPIGSGQNPNGFEQQPNPLISGSNIQEGQGQQPIAENQLGGGSSQQNYAPMTPKTDVEVPQNGQYGSDSQIDEFEGQSSGENGAASYGHEGAADQGAYGQQGGGGDAGSAIQYGQGNANIPVTNGAQSGLYGSSATGDGSSAGQYDQDITIGQSGDSAQGYRSNAGFDGASGQQGSVYGQRGLDGSSGQQEGLYGQQGIVNGPQVDFYGGDQQLAGNGRTDQLSGSLYGYGHQQPLDQTQFGTYQPPASYQQPSGDGTLYQTYGSRPSDFESGGEASCVGRKDGYHRHPTDCTKFLQCHRSTGHVLSCAPSLVFNPSISTCDWPRNVPDCSSIGTVSDPECVGRKHGEFFRLGDCRKFFRCVHGKVYKFDCPANLFFNMKLKVCDWPKNVPECGASMVSYSR